MSECPYGGGDHRELIRQAEQQGREDNADHSMCYVHGSKALEALIRQAKAEERERIALAIETEMWQFRRMTGAAKGDLPCRAYEDAAKIARRGVSDEPGEGA